MNERKKIFLLLLTSGILTGISVAFSKYLGFLEWISLIPLALALNKLRCLENLKLRHAYLYGLFYFECFYAVCFHWFIYLYPLDFTGLNNFYSVIVIILACFGLSFLQALFGGLVFLIYVLVSRLTLPKKFPIINLISLPVIYTFYEFTQTLGWWGVPWGRLSLGQVDMLLPVEAASLFGSYFITAVIVLVNSLLAFALTEMRDGNRSKKYALTALTVFVANMALGSVLMLMGERAVGEDSITVGVVQGNYDSTEKWTSSPQSMLDKHLDLTRGAASDGAELVIWAETALPFGLHPKSIYSIQISEVAREYGITVLVGAMSYDDGEEYNAVFCYNPDGTVDETLYKKRHLVPFGEYVPMRSFIETVVPFMSEISMLDEDMTPGTDSEIFDTDIGKVGSLICFDSIYEMLSRDSVRDGAELIAISTNDSWFSDSAGIYMHNNQARLRAIENGRYVARSANTGISCFISSTGEILSELPPLTEGYLCEEVYLSGRTTLYKIIGNTFVYLLGTMILVPFAYEAFLEIKRKNANKCK